MISQVIMALFGTIAFAVLFNVPRRHWIYCGAIGSTGWLVYLLTVLAVGSEPLGIFVSATILTIMARWFSHLRKTPTTVFLLSGIFTLVPGAGIYHTTYNMFMNNRILAWNYGLETAKAAGAIALGIAAAYMVPGKIFGWKKESWN